MVPTEPQRKKAKISRWGGQCKEAQHSPSSSWRRVTTPSTLAFPLSTATAFLVAAVMMRERLLATASIGMWLTRTATPWKAEWAVTAGATREVETVDIVIAVAAIAATSACMQTAKAPRGKYQTRRDQHRMGLRTQVAGRRKNHAAGKERPDRGHRGGATQSEKEDWTKQGRQREETRTEGKRRAGQGGKEEGEPSGGGGGGGREGAGRAEGKTHGRRGDERGMPSALPYPPRLRPGILSLPLSPLNPAPVALALAAPVAMLAHSPLPLHPATLPRWRHHSPPTPFGWDLPSPCYIHTTSPVVSFTGPARPC